MKVSDRVTGAMLVALGAASFWGGSLLPPVPGQQVGPNVFPMVIGAALVACGVLIIMGVGRTFEEDEKIVTSASGEVADEEALQPAQGRLEFEKVSFRYPTRPDVSALHEFTLAVMPGETVALVGPSEIGRASCRERV